MASGIDIGKAYVRIEPTAKGIGNKIESVLNQETDGVGASVGSKLAGGIGTGLKLAGGAIAAGVTAASAAVVSLGKEAVSSYANYEQLIGGVEKLYGDAAGKLEQFANEAYKTSGMSANAYMETATSFSAALISSLDGDVNTAANMTDIAMRSISDNVNTFGSNMESVTNAFQGFAKGQFNMLDNLKLGYGGTKEEMERLLRDAEEYEGFIEGSLSIDNFADIIEAIDIVQEHLNIAGTTEAEAMRTIEGSATATKAAWENVITAIGRGEGLKEALDALTSSIFGAKEGEGLLNQIIPRIQTVMEGIGEFVATAAPFISDKLPELVNSILPSLLSAASSLVTSLGEGILSALPTIMPIATQVLMQLAQTLIDHLPEIISVGVQIIGQLIVGISQALPELIPAAIDAILTIVDNLINNIDLLIDCAVQLITGLAVGLVKAIPVLVEKAPIIIEKLVLGIIAAVPKLILAAGQIMVNFAQALNNIAPRLHEVGQNLVTGLKNGFINAWNGFVAKVKDMANNLISSVKNVFSTHSPSRVFEQIGDWCVQGFDIGFESFGDGAVKDVQNAMDEISAVGSPTINPEIATSADAFRYQSVGGNTSDLYGLLSTYLPLLERQTSVNVSLEGDAQGLFRQVRSQTNQFIKSTGASPFLSPA